MEQTENLWSSNYLIHISPICICVSDNYLTTENLFYTNYLLAFFLFLLFFIISLQLECRLFHLMPSNQPRIKIFAALILHCLHCSASLIPIVAGRNGAGGGGRQWMEMWYRIWFRLISWAITRRNIFHLCMMYTFDFAGGTTC